MFIFTLIPVSLYFYTFLWYNQLLRSLKGYDVSVLYVRNFPISWSTVFETRFIFWRLAPTLFPPFPSASVCAPWCYLADLIWFLLPPWESLPTHIQTEVKSSGNPNWVLQVSEGFLSMQFGLAPSLLSPSEITNYLHWFSSPCKGSSSSGGQEITGLLQKPKAHYCTRKTAQPNPTLRQLDPPDTHTSYTIHFSISSYLRVGVTFLPTLQAFWLTKAICR